MPKRNQRLETTYSTKSFTDLALGLVGPSEMRAEVEDPDLPYDLVLELVLEAGDMGKRYLLANLHVARRPGGPEVTGELVRHLPLRGIARSAIWDGLRQFMPGEVASTLAKPARELRRLGQTEETLRAVATTYQVALLAGDPPTKAVTALLGASRPTALRWLAAAREHGFLVGSDEVEVEEVKPRGKRRTKS